MKTKFLLLVFLLLPSVSFGVVSIAANGQCYSPDMSTSRLCLQSYFHNKNDVALNITCENVSGNYIDLYDIDLRYDFVHAVPAFPVSCPTCASGQSWDNISQTCIIAPAPNLSSFDNDPQGCSNAGGYFYSAGTDQVGGTSYGASFFGGSGIMLGGDLQSITKCGTLGDVVGQVASTALSMVPLASSLFGSSGLKKLANLAFLDKLNSLPNISPKPTTFPDYLVGLPKLPSPGSSSMSPKIPISESSIPISTNNSGITGPSRSSSVSPDSGYSSIPDTFIPTKTSGEPLVDYSIVDRYNGFSHLSSSPKLSDLVPPVGSSLSPVKETFDLSYFLPDQQSPTIVTTVPVLTTKSQTFSGSYPVDIYTSTRSYPDGSSSSQTVKINTSTKLGSFDVSTLSSTGETSTIYETIYVPTYTGTLTGDIIVQPPTGTTFSPPSVTVDTPTTTVITSTIPSDSTVTNPDVISAQPADSIINAVMPSYNFPSLLDFIPFDSTPITDMISGASDMFFNINKSLSDTALVFTNTKNLLTGSWTPPQIDPGQCGEFMAFNFHNRHVDLCPPMASATSQFSPIISSVFTIVGMSVAVGIFLGGF